MIKVEKVYGESDLQELLQKLNDRGIKADVLFSGGNESKSYTVTYEDKKILNEG